MAHESKTDATALDEPSHISGQSLALITHKLNEERVKKHFWPKIRKVAARIPFAADLMAVYYCARDPATPVTAKGVLVAALAYFVMPFDAVPDVLLGIGFTDDAAVLAAAVAIIGKHLKQRHKDQALAVLRQITAEDPAS